MMLNNFGGASTVYNSHGQDNSKDTSAHPQSMDSTSKQTAWGYAGHDGLYSGAACYPGPANHQPMYTVDQYKTNTKYTLPQDYARYPQYSSGTLHHPIPVKCSEMCCQHVSEAPHRYPLNPPPPSFQFSSHHVQPPRYTDYPTKHYAYNKRDKSNYPQMHADYPKYAAHNVRQQKEMKEPKAVIESHCAMYPVAAQNTSYWTTNGWMPPPPPPPYHQSRVPKPVPPPPPPFHDQESRKGVIMNGAANMKQPPAADYPSFRTECYELPSSFMTCSFSTANNRLTSMNSNNSSSMHQSSVSSNYNSNSASNSSVASSHCQIVDKQHAQITANQYSQATVVPNRVISNANCRRIVAGSTTNHLMNDNPVYSESMRSMESSRASITPEDSSSTNKAAAASECSQQEVSLQKKRPQLEKRQDENTWDDDEEEGARASPATAPPPLIVLDCRNIAEHEIRRVRDKLSSWENLQSQANSRRDMIDKTIINNMIAKPVIANEKISRDDHLSSESIMMCATKKPVQNSYESNLRNSKSSHLMADSSYPEIEHNFNHHHHLLHHMHPSRQQYSSSWDHSDVNKSPAGGSTVLETHQSTPVQPVFPHTIQHYEKKSNVSVVEPVPMISRNPTNYILDPPELKEQSPLEHLVNFYGDHRRLENNNAFDIMQDRNRIYAPKPTMPNSNPIQTEHVQSFDSPPGEMFCEPTSILKLVDSSRANIITNSIKPNSIEFDGNVLETSKTNVSSNQVDQLVLLAIAILHHYLINHCLLCKKLQ
ncbi:hypothetical protein LSTR_LSTR015184 [Laodelphax striatellus]|uniref:Uncharacterized protein n=1 Tax=Laodelphax striatellus TaxID=195883 RepID=A0A482WYX9_LAOST|nr:hypothetical protein LSTR_LSTR015184 [Laodelphax striatellus]